MHAYQLLVTTAYTQLHLIRATPAAFAGYLCLLHKTYMHQHETLPQMPHSPEQGKKPAVDLLVNKIATLLVLTWRTLLQDVEALCHNTA